MGKVLKFPVFKTEASTEVSPWAEAWDFLSRHSRSPAIFDVLSVQDIDRGFDDESGKKLEIIFASRTSPAGDLRQWCDLTNGNKDHWLITVQRKDSKTVSGRVSAFTLLPTGLVAHVHLLHGMAEYLPDQTVPEKAPCKLVLHEPPCKRHLKFVTRQYALSQ